MYTTEDMMVDYTLDRVNSLHNSRAAILKSCRPQSDDRDFSLVCMQYTDSYETLMVIVLKQH